MSDDLPACKVILPPQCHHLPINEIQDSVRGDLVTKLNPETSSYNRNNIRMNWEGLAELANFSREDNIHFRSQQSPCDALLEELGKKQGMCVGQLWKYLHNLERFDIIEDEKFIKNLSLQAQNYEQRKQQKIQDSAVTSADEEKMTRTVKEMNTGKREKIHAFVSHCPQDSQFVLKTLKPKLEKMNFRLYITDIDMIPGGDELQIIPLVMAIRCPKIILVMTPAYLESKEFQLQHRVAQALSADVKKRFIIPLLLKPLVIPLVLRFICIVDHTRCDLVQYFWIRLKAALRDDAVKLPEAEMVKIKALSKKPNREIRDDDKTPNREIRDDDNTAHKQNHAPMLANQSGSEPDINYDGNYCDPMHVNEGACSNGWYPSHLEYGDHTTKDHHMPDINPPTAKPDSGFLSPRPGPHSLNGEVEHSSIKVEAELNLRPLQEHVKEHCKEHTMEPETDELPTLEFADFHFACDENSVGLHRQEQFNLPISCLM